MSFRLTKFMPSFSNILRWSQENRQWLTQNYLQGLILSSIFFGIYLEMKWLSKMGGIFIRPGPDNRKHFSLSGIVPMLKYPFQSLNYWRPSYWDLNFIIFTQVGTAIYMVLKSHLC